MVQAGAPVVWKPYASKEKNVTLNSIIIVRTAAGHFTLKWSIRGE